MSTRQHAACRLRPLAPPPPAHPALLLSRPLISYLRKFYYYDPEEEIHPSLKERGAEPSPQPVVQPQT